MDAPIAVDAVGWIMVLGAPLAVYLVAARYLQKSSRTRFHSLVYGGSVALGAWGAILLIAAAVIPNAMPDLSAYVLLAIPILLACLVFVFRAGRKAFGSADQESRSP
jgi:hypothetical protein